MSWMSIGKSINLMSGDNDLDKISKVVLSILQRVRLMYEDK